MFPFLSVLLWCYYGQYKNPWVIWPVGLGVIALGGLLRVWSIRYIGRSARTRQEKAKSLLTIGPYGIIRNPLYVANILLCLGACVCFGLIWYVPVLALFLIIHYTLVILAEESFLFEKYGEHFKLYRDMVPRWIPWGCNWLLIKARPEHSWREALTRELPGAGLVLAVVILVIVKDMIGGLIGV
jgi:protein-S-isoprenylcysteine O-methyltransferase Ste14